VRVVNRTEQCVGYRLNLIGVRVYRDHCRLVARIDGQWVPIGAPRPLPLTIAPDPEQTRGDALLATVAQYEKERPGSDLREVLSQTKSLDDVLEQESQTNTAGR
jgi:hypothetical protein